MSLGGKILCIHRHPRTVDNTAKIQQDGMFVNLEYGDPRASLYSQSRAGVDLPDSQPALSVQTHVLTMVLLSARGVVVGLWCKHSPLKKGFAVSTTREEHIAVSPEG